MKVKITKEAGWDFEYDGNIVTVPRNAVLNGDTADEALAAGAGVQTDYSDKATHPSTFKLSKQGKKALAGAPENKGRK